MCFLTRPRVCALALCFVAAVLTSPAFAQVDISEGGVSGEWFNPDRDGEGFFVEVVENNDQLQFVVAWFTYDEQGNQMWVVGAQPISSSTTTVLVPVQVTFGALFGDEFDPNDVVREDWGTLRWEFPDCNTARMDYDSFDFGSGTIDLTRLTKLKGVDCEEPT